jgi:hypothetical protein
MRALLGLFVLTVLAVTMISVPAMAAGTGVKIFVPTESSVSADQLPLLYNGSFIVQNDGLLQGVYVVRVAVDDPSAITWVNVTPSGFVLAPGEMRQVRFSINVPEGQAAFGTYNLVFMPSLLPQNVEPYLDTFANYVSMVDRYNFTVQINAIPPEMAYAYNGSPLTPVIFSEDQSRVNLVQFVSPESDNRVVTQIDRAVRINVPHEAAVDQPVNVTISVFEGLSSRGIDLMAISPEGIFYPIEDGNITFDRTGRWGVIAMIGDLVLLGKPVDVTEGGLKLVVPGLGTILAALALLMLVSLVPIWLISQPAGLGDPYEEIAYKAYVIKRHLDKFDMMQLRRAVHQLREEYDGLAARKVRGNRKKARSALAELETLSGFESLSNI